MFEFSIMWLITIIVSFILNLATGSMQFKDVADLGYKIDVERFTGIMREVNPGGTSNSLLKMMIPFYNLYIQYQTRVQYLQHRDAVLRQLDVMGTLEEMSEWEKKEYEKNPTGFNAMLVIIRSVSQLNNSVKIKFPNNQGTIWFTNDKKTKDILIVKAEGAIANLTPEEQKQKIREFYNKFVDDIIEEYGSFEFLENEIKKSIDNGETEINIKISKKSTSEQIEDLKELRDELTGEETTEVKENGYQKTNKKDK